jgi:hypothetical protein
VHRQPIPITASTKARSAASRATIRSCARPAARFRRLFAPGAGNRYYLVVPRNATREGLLRGEQLRCRAARGDARVPPAAAGGLPMRAPRADR